MQGHLKEERSRIVLLYPMAQVKSVERSRVRTFRSKYLLSSP
jgi:hypothetical protein